ncbi:MAG: YncE family protein [Armatimonadota bacterium]|nr:YncE family protein [Armatimonadota bacterium]MDR7436231.1 YncE family protein [Armatimonadota bacterium]MDR7471389.1 YncE family protein [Armatimonadota bacterium]MDR7508155.1 YncE family protein [Armatimonadota bacterium]MDR7509527.1 YncE family protein [Armatimonadota bacterium]
MRLRAWITALAAALAVAAAAPAAVGRPRAQIFVLSNSAPHVVVVDGQTHQVVRTADLPEGGAWAWAWNDDNNYFDGTHLWLGRRFPATDEVEVVLLDVTTLQIARRVPLGTDRTTLYIGKPTRDGRVFVSKHASGELAVLDARTASLLQTAPLPVDGGVACDVDAARGPLERVLVPTDTGNAVLAVDPATLQVVARRAFEGTRPFMLTTSPDGRQVWVQERTGNSITVLNARTLDVIRRIPTGRTPIVGTFSPDGAVHITGHAADVIVLAHDTRTFREVWRARVGTSPDKVGVHPAGTYAYATVSREGTLAVLDLATGRVVMRVALGTNPTGLYVRRL